jgi:site-specific DNA-methyltransferase (adenine-specific)/modification methylase
MLIDGHLRTETLHNAEIPVLVLDVSEEEADKILATFDPLGAMAESDADALRALLEDVETGSQELADMLTALAEDAGILDGADAAEIVEDEVPEPPVDPITKPGDLWILGDHRLLCGDSTKAEDVERLMGGGKIRACISDPPYGIAFCHGGNDTSGIGKGKYKTKFAGVPVHGDDKPFDPSALLSFDIVILWGANHFASKLPDKPSWLIWDKRAASEHQNDFADCEIAWSNSGKVARVFRHQWDGMIKASERGESRVHPTQKPVALMAWCIEQVDNPETIYDPFLGSGTTLIAAEQLGRKCYGMEISPQYCDVIVKRWETLTGRQAERRGSNDQASR